MVNITRSASVDSPPARQLPPSSPFSDDCKSLRTSTILEDQYCTSPSHFRSFKLPSASWDRIYEEGGTEHCDFFRRSCTVVDPGRSVDSAESDSAESDSAEQSLSGRSSPAGVPPLPEWPELDPAAFERGKALLGSMEMDPTRFSLNDVCHLALEIFEAAGLPDELAANVGRVQRFILAVREGMHDNAYHNFYHVFDVTQTVSVMARRTGTLDRLNAWERFALLAAALCHDLEHPGVTSVFLDRAGGSVAGAFKDTVLEKHHVLRAFEVMVGQDIGLLKGLSSESYWDFRNAVAGCILATDFAKHADYCNQVRMLAQEGASRPIPIQLEMELIIKCADISNVLKPFPVARRWALRVTDEFFAQGDVERARGMDVTPSCDREKQSCVDLQVGFIDHMCAPFFDAVATLYPALRPDVARLHQNSAKWAAYSDAELASFRREQDASELEASQQAAELEHDSEQHRSGDQRSSPDSDARPSDARSRLPRRGSDARSRLPRLNHVDEDSVGSPSTSSFSPLCVSPGQLTPGLEVMMRRALERQASSSQESLDAFAPSPYLMWGPG